MPDVPFLSVASADSAKPVVSPTGVPSIPTAYVPYLVTLVGLATIATQVLPPHTMAFKIASGLVGLGGILGLASPGLRKK